MTNLSELFPSGGGAVNQAEFVASGNLSNGQAVVLNSNGTVTSVSENNGDITDYGNYVSSTPITNSDNEVWADWDHSNDVLVVCFEDNTNSNYLTVVAGSVSGQTISFGTPVTMYSSYQPEPLSVDINHHPTANNGIVCLIMQSQIQSVVAEYTVTGTTVALIGTTTRPDMTGSDYFQCLGYNANDTTWYMISSYYWTGQHYFWGITASGSGPSISGTYGTHSYTYKEGQMSYDETEQCVLFVGRSTSGTSHQKYAVIDGYYNPSVSTSGDLGGSYGEATRVAYDANAQRHLVVYNDAATQGQDTLKVRVLQISSGGSSVSLGTAYTFYTATQYGSSQFAATYDSINKRIIVVWQRNDNNYDLRACVVKIIPASNTIGQGTEVTIAPASAYSNTRYYVDITFDPTTGRCLPTYINYEPGSVGFSADFIEATDVFTNGKFIGFTDAAISNGQSGKVNMIGGISTNQTGLTVNSKYYLQTDGTVTTANPTSAVFVGQAVSSSIMNIKELA